MEDMAADAQVLDVGRRSTVVGDAQVLDVRRTVLRGSNVEQLVLSSEKISYQRRPSIRWSTLDLVGRRIFHDVFDDD